MAICLAPARQPIAVASLRLCEATRKPPGCAVRGVIVGEQRIPTLAEGASRFVSSALFFEPHVRAPFTRRDEKVGADLPKRQLRDLIRWLGRCPSSEMRPGCMVDSDANFVAMAPGEAEGRSNVRWT